MRRLFLLIVLFAFYANAQTQTHTIFEFGPITTQNDWVGMEDVFHDIMINDYEQFANVEYVYSCNREIYAHVNELLSFALVVDKNQHWSVVMIVRDWQTLNL